MSLTDLPIEIIQLIGSKSDCFKTIISLKNTCQKTRKAIDKRIIFDTYSGLFINAVYDPNDKFISYTYKTIKFDEMIKCTDNDIIKILIKWSNHLKLYKYLKLVYSGLSISSLKMRRRCNFKTILSKLLYIMTLDINDASLQHELKKECIDMKDEIKRYNQYNFPTENIDEEYEEVDEEAVITLEDLREMLFPRGMMFRRR